MNTSNKRNKRGWFVICAVVAFTFGMSAQAASFDCGKAGTRVEHLICGNSELSNLDDELAAKYDDALKDKTRVKAIRRTQRTWLRERNKCANARCVEHAYEMRLLSLNQNTSASTDVAASKSDDLPTRQTKSRLSSTSSSKDENCLAPKIDWRNYEWTLITGNGLPVCEEMLSYLKSRPADVAPPTCPDERLPPNGNWTRPESRVLSEAEKQNLLRDIPEQYRQKPHGPVSYEREIKDSRLLRVIRGDITGDGEQESFLAIGGYDGLKNCERSKRCARPEEIFKKGIVLTSDAYDLLPMNEEGTEIDWGHKVVIQPMGGELIFYKRLPYWISHISWSQASNDDFVRYSTRPDDPYSAIFTLAEIGVGPVINGNKTPRFKDVTVVAMEHNPESNRVCRFGYFRRENLNQYQTTKGR